VTTCKVTMTPDTVGWAPDSLLWASGCQGGLWQEFTDPAAGDGDRPRLEGRAGAHRGEP
jgi:hypothetical protein